MDTAATLSRPGVRSLAAGVGAMTLVGGSVGVSRVLVDAPLFTAQAIRYAAAALVLLGLAGSARVPIVRPRGREWLWLAGIAATGLVVFNVAVVRGVAHAEPAVIAVAVACVPILLGIVGPRLEGQSPRRQILVAAVVVTIGRGPAGRMRPGSPGRRSRCAARRRSPSWPSRCWPATARGASRCTRYGWVPSCWRCSASPPRAPVRSRS